MAKSYDVVIVGSGPAGIFTALELSELTTLNILMLEKGKDLKRRQCPGTVGYRGCRTCSPCDMVSGWGGAGAYSDGKLTLTPEVGGRLPWFIGEDKGWEMVRQVDRRFLDFGGNNHVFGIDTPDSFKTRAQNAGLTLIPMPVRHLGTERCHEILQDMHDYLIDRVDMRTDLAVKSIMCGNRHVTGVELETGEFVNAKYVVVAPGREGSDWLIGEARRVGLTLHNNPVDLGLRVEVSHHVFKEFTDILYEPKLEYHSSVFNDRIRTFCVCPSGEVTMEATGGDDPVVTVNGHSYADRKTENTNFALLGSAKFGKPFRDPITYGKSVARLANLLADGVIMQRFGDLIQGHCSQAHGMGDWEIQPTLCSATPGDINAVLPHRFLQGITEMLLALDKLAPGMASPDTILYGIEVKFYSSRIHLTQNLETEIENLFTIGDGAGVTRGLVQASASGIIAANEIMRRKN